MGGSPDGRHDATFGHKNNLTGIGKVSDFGYGYPQLVLV